MAEQIKVSVDGGQERLYPAGVTPWRYTGSKAMAKKNPWRPSLAERSAT